MSNFTLSMHNETMTQSRKTISHFDTILFFTSGKFTQLHWIGFEEQEGERKRDTAESNEVDTINGVLMQETFTFAC